MQRRNCKVRPSYLLLQKSEWIRLKKQSGPPEQPSNEYSEYVKSLIEKSNAWTCKWPDHERGRVALHEQEEKKQHAEDIAAAKEAADRRQSLGVDNEEAIKVAKEKIFRESCYGQKLLFALHESKMYEERDVQVKFLNCLRDKEKELENKSIEPSCSFALDKHAIEDEKFRKCNTVQISRQNKEISEKHQAEIAMAKEAQKYEDQENTQLMNKLLNLEAMAEEKVRTLENEALQQFLAEHKESKEHRAEREAEYSAKIEMCRKEKEELNNKIKRVLKEIQKGADELPWATKNFEAFKQRQQEEIKRLKILEDKIHKTSETSSANQERESREKEKQDLAKRLSITEANKAMAECERIRRCPHLNKCVCDRQSLFVKTHRERVNQECITTEEKYRPQFGPCNKLTIELKKRMLEPPPWTGVKAKHEEFVRQANLTLKECKYKKPGRKVVDEYMKCHNLDTIDIPNY